VERWSLLEKLKQSRLKANRGRNELHLEEKNGKMREHYRMKKVVKMVINREIRAKEHE
jgi:hypothetical protein